ncbi:FAD-dependent oxidoreductase [Bradyrhizobium sp. INPA01-394B]|uniref:FAD-dependent oxidoreductase n=1 Tax=Bradyrhizobium campsiandrae TaxID=1729892 RepID=A0ABR7UA29_9BRAD|nr:FAD-dependent oxidoreductase [Bradyrhizobium campsiandrae]MBC9881734.1 FAD-dependent oxidoreductase [Bradyrhizobium campsiandrae]MBC9980903.1 FAD-dependent oxidoreductase [Bradyrhizobium campsiandrae]
MTKPVVIVGAGHAGVQAAAALREEKYAGRIVLVGDELHVPYHRPPLSKAYLKGALGRDSLALRGAAYYGNQGIETLFGDRVISIDRGARKVELASNRELEYEHLILAVGARARPVPFAGTDLGGVVTLRNLDDADILKRELDAARHVVVVGAGFIGLEFAATARGAGKDVTIVEVAPRVMGRAVSPQTSNFFADAHRAFGAELRLNVGVEKIEGNAGRARAVHLTDGSVLSADLVLLGTGVVAEDRLARDSGLVCEDGLVVNARLVTSDPDISAIGDCSFHPNVWQGGEVRLESVQNATDQARVVAKRLAGRPVDYSSLPWFWSDQGDLKLQIAGLLVDSDKVVVRGEIARRAFSVFCFSGDRLRCVESVNRGGDHMAARRIIGDNIALSPAEARDPSFDLKAHATRHMRERA